MKTKDIVIIAASTFLVIIGAYISLPIGPVPIVLTNFFIVLIALLLGPKKSLIVISTYVLLGAIGLPVFSNGKGGLGHLVGLTGGFIFGFIPLMIISSLAYNRNLIIKIVAVLIGSITLYAVGIPWAMYVYNNVIAPVDNKPLWDFATTIKYCVTPFLIPDLIKIVLAIAFIQLFKGKVDPFLSNE